MYDYGASAKLVRRDHNPAIFAVIKGTRQPYPFYMLKHSKYGVGDRNNKRVTFEINENL